MQNGENHSAYLTGQLLIAMPGMSDPRFIKTVVYICAHNADGAMGLVVNRANQTLGFPDLLKQLEIFTVGDETPIEVLFGGPVESERGFVLHSPDYVQDATLVVDDHIALTATTDMLKVIAGGGGPHNRILALGYAGWGPGQLDSEIMSNGWLNVDADDELVFGHDLEHKWEHAIQKIGIDPRMLSGESGHA